MACPHGVRDGQVSVQQRAQGVGIGRDRRVGPLGLPSRDPQPPAGDLDQEAVLAEPERHDRVEPLRGLGVEQRLEGQDEGVDADRGVAPQPR
ncbi:hypothetical protein GCM10020219_028270 [Nonomuraea dietziae]